MALPVAWLIAPPALVVNEKVAATPALAATRSVPDIEKVGLSTLSPMAPEDTVFDTVSKSVSTFMFPPAVGVLPIVTPVNVMVTELPFPMAPLFFVRTTDVAAKALAVQEAADATTVGKGLVAKKSEG